jgi:hypothetical protein
MAIVHLDGSGVLQWGEVMTGAKPLQGYPLQELQDILEFPATHRVMGDCG